LELKIHIILGNRLKIKTLWIFALLLSTTLYGQKTVEQSYNFRNFSSDNGLPSSETYDVKQDHEGNIWIATDRGVVKYDGIRFIVYTKQDGLLENVVLQLYKDPFGRIWFLSSGNELCYYEKGKIVPYAFNHVLRTKLIHSNLSEKSILFLKNKTLVLSLRNYGTFVINHKGLLKKQKQRIHTLQILSFGGKKICSLHYPFSASAKIIDSFCNIYYPTSKKGKPVFLAQQKNSVVRLKYVPSRENGFLLVNNHLYNLPKRKEILKKNKDLIIHIGSIDGKLLVGKLNKGVAIYRMVRGIPILEKNILTDYSVSNSLRDKQGGYWFSTLEGGVFYLPFFEVEGITVKDGLLSNGIKNIFGFKNGIYFGFFGAGIQRLCGSQLTTLNKTYEYCSFGKVRNKLIVSSIFGTFLDDSLINERFQRDLYTMNQSCLMVTSFPYEMGKEEICQLIEVKNLQPSEDFQAIMKDPKGMIWLGNRDGLHYLQNDTRVTYKPESFKVSVTDIQYHPKWGKIVATRENGLFLLQNNREIKMEGLLSEDTKNIFVDSKDRVWVGTPKGLNILSKKGGKIIVDCLTKHHGLYSNEINSVFVDHKFAWIGTNKGVSKVQYDALKQYHGDHKIQLKSIYLQNKRLDLSKKLEISHQEDVVKIHFGTTNFITKGVYKYRLHPNAKWVYVNKPVVTLLNPEDGLYHLEVAFLSENNKWSSIQKIASFEIVPPFWRTYFFKFLIVLAIGFTVFLFVRFKKKQFETKQKLLLLEQKALFAQMNPHFIFNTLNSIQSFHLYNELDKAEYFLGKFSKLLRETLHVSRKSSVSIKTEISMLEKYLELEQMRFSNKFLWRIHCSITTSLLTQRIPSMLIQPYVENSIKHGFTEKGKEYVIEIVLKQLNASTLQCNVIDNGIGRTASLQRKEKTQSTSDHVSYGEKITKERLKSYNQKKNRPYGTEIIDRDSENGKSGTIVKIFIPILKT
jgi:ligand-binding sensor domain-containing protein